MSKIVCFIDLTTPVTYFKDVVINVDGDESLIEVIPTTTSSTTKTQTTTSPTSTLSAPTSALSAPTSTLSAPTSSLSAPTSTLSARTSTLSAPTSTLTSSAAPAAATRTTSLDESHPSTASLSKKNKPHQLSKMKTRSNTSKEISTEIKNKNLGECPICWDEFGKNPLASTKCGHIFCTACLKQSLKLERKCPTCRRGLRGKMSYHPLYI